MKQKTFLECLLSINRSTCTSVAFTMLLFTAVLFSLTGMENMAYGSSPKSHTVTMPDEQRGTENMNWDDVASRVEIRRDEYGIPHILGKDKLAAYFGLGYAQAEDHMQNMAHSFLRARGEASRYFGRMEIDNDFAMQRMNNLEEARKDLRRVSPEFRDVVRAYAAGLDHYIAKHGSQLPDWVAEAGSFTAADVMALIRSRSVFEILSPRVQDMLSRKYGSPGDASNEHRPRQGGGSNAFALAGSRTESGNSILLASPHLMWSSLYWEAQITVPGEIDFFGNTLAGYPVLWAGFNNSLGWANTVNHADLDDIYALEIDPDHPDKFILDDQSKDLHRKSISVKFIDENGVTKEERRTYWYTEYGPVVYRTNSHVFVVKSARLDAPASFEGFYRLSQTSDLDEFRNVFKNYPVFSCNFIYSDKKGNILYLWQAMLPKRDDDGTDYSLDVHIDSSEQIWKELHSFDDMPELLNPEHGVVTNSNNPPWWASTHDWINKEDYPSYYERGKLALRPQLAMDLLDTLEKYSVQDVIDLTFNTRMLLAERTVPDLLSVLIDDPDQDDDTKSAFRILKSWDRHVSSGSRGAVLFKRFWDTYSKSLPQPFAIPWSEHKPTTTPRGLADKELALSHVKEALHWVRSRYGSEDVAWGDVHRLRSSNYDLPGDGADGSYGTFHVLSYADAHDGKKVIGLDKNGPPLVGFGSNWIMLVEFGQTVRAWSVLASGESGHMDSPHSDDQLKLFQAHQLRPVWFTEQEIKAHTVSSYKP